MDTRKPAYIRIYEKLREGITAGSWPYGSRIPSRRTLADTTGCSLVTVDHALELLAEEGYIEPKERSGCFVCYRGSDAFPAAPEIPLPLPAPEAPGEVDVFPFSVLARAMRRVLSDYGDRILTKSPNRGCMQLRTELARYLARSRGMTVSPEQIIIGSGAEYLYGLILETLGRDRRYAIESPSYEKIEQVYLARGVRCELLPLGREGIRSESLASCRAEVLHITPYRSFPSGVTASASKRREYIRWAASGQRWIVEDDFESEFTLTGKPADTVFVQSGAANVIYMNTFSRTVSPSLRVGYMVLPERLLDTFEERVGFYSCTVPAFEQYVLADLIARGDLERHISRVRRALRKGERTARRYG